MLKEFSEVENIMRLIVDCVESSFEISSIFKDAVRNNKEIDKDKMRLEIKSHFLSLMAICNELNLD